MKMVDMKLKESQKETAVSVDMNGNGPRYPWGLNIRLENEVVEKLGMADELPSVGEEIIIMAKAKIESVSMSENSDKSKNRSVSIQITEMGIKEKEMDIEKSMYGE